MRSFAITRYKTPLECIETDLPVPTGTEVLLKVKACGVCHTDLHIWEGGYDMGGGKTLKMSDRGQRLPHTMGHEIVGEVSVIGPDAKNTVEVGQTRLVYPWNGCGNCEICLSADEHLCPAPQYVGVLQPGGYANYILVKHPRYLLDTGDLSPAEAAPYACSGLTAYSALKKVGKQRLTSPILIIGAGGLGLMCLSLIKAMEGKGAVVLDIDSGKRAAALQAGAIAAIDPRAENVSAQISEAAGGPISAIVDFVGSPASWDLAMGSLSKGGVYVIVGLFGGERTLSLATLPLRAITVAGSFVGSRRELIELMALVREGNVVPMPITMRALTQASDTLMDLKEGRIIGRAILIPAPEP